MAFIGVLEFNTCSFNLVRRYKAHTRDSIPAPIFSLFAFVRWHGRYVQPPLKRGRNAPELTAVMRAVCTGLAVATPCNSSRDCSNRRSCYHPPCRFCPKPQPIPRCDGWDTCITLVPMLISLSFTVATHHGCNLVGGRCPHVCSHQGNPKLDQ